MTTKLGKIVADFQTQLATSIAIGGTTATIQSATDDDGVSLPAGNYYFTIDGDNTSKEHIFCALSGTSLTSIQSVSRQGVLSSGTVRKHRIGATITITDFAHISKINDLLTGVTDLNGSTPLAYDAEPTFSYGNHELVTWDKAKDYADGLAIAGAPDSDDTTKGLLERATMAEIENGTSSGSTTAPLAVVSGRFGARLYTAYAVDGGANDTYAITCNPAPTQYSTGMVITFKANTANTGACTVNVNSLGAKAIQKRVAGGLVDLDDGDIGASAIITAIYNGTQFELQSRESKQKVSQSGAEIYAADAGANDTYAITLSPALSAYTTGMAIRFKANTANTGAATLNVNSLGAKTIKKNVSQDLETGDISANQIITVVYDGTNFQLQSIPSEFVRFTNGVSSHDIATTGTQTIAHGLGKTPLKVVIRAVKSESPTGNLSSTGVYDGTTQAYVYNGFSDTLAPESGGGTANVIALVSGTGSVDKTATAEITGLDDTNITLNWAKSGTPGGTAYFTWEVEG